MKSLDEIIPNIADLKNILEEKRSLRRELVLVLCDIASRAWKAFPDDMPSEQRQILLNQIFEKYFLEVSHSAEVLDLEVNNYFKSKANAERVAKDQDSKQLKHFKEIEEALRKKLVEYEVRQKNDHQSKSELQNKYQECKSQNNKLQDEIGKLHNNILALKNRVDKSDSYSIVFNDANDRLAKRNEYIRNTRDRLMGKIGLLNDMVKNLTVGEMKKLRLGIKSEDKENLVSLINDIWQITTQF